LWYVQATRATPARTLLAVASAITQRSPRRRLKDSIIAILTVPAAVDDSPSAATYASLKRRIQDAGLLQPEFPYSALLVGANTLGYLTLFVLLGIVQAWWAIAGLALILGFASGQLGFQLHDSGHRQLFGGRRLNSAIGIVTANLLLGMSYGWWVDKHNRHHGNPNHVDLDPDIKVGMVSYSTEQALAKRGILRGIAARQAYFFFPLLFGLAWAMHVSSVMYLVRHPSRLRAVAEGSAMIAHIVIYLSILTVAVGPWWALAVVLIHKSVGGFYMASVFAPNHKGMPQVMQGQKLDFLQSQVLTSRNVRSHRLTDYVYGGLNYQIEHHLFPTMPRRHLREAQGIIRDFCGVAGVEYYETSIVQSYREILSFLHEVGEPLRQPRPLRLHT